MAVSLIRHFSFLHSHYVYLGCAAQGDIFIFQKRVQVELDKEVGHDKSVTLADEPRLHYTRAVLQEIHRVGAIVPMAVPHRVEQDTVLQGYDIPKKTLVRGACDRVLFSLLSYYSR